MQSTQFTSHQGPPSSIKDDFFTTETYANLATKNHNRSIFHFSQSVTTADLKLLANRSANKCRNAQSVRKERYLEGTKKSGSTYSLSVTYRLAVSPAAAVLNFYFDFFSSHFHGCLDPRFAFPSPAESSRDRFILQFACFRPISLTHPFSPLSS